MIEREMGYRGSKSAFNNLIYSGAARFIYYLLKVVKEQRVDDGYVGFNNSTLRYTLTGFERNYQIKILSKQICNIGTRKYSTFIDIKSELNINLNPWFVTGFCDGEACFYVGVQKNNKSKLGWNVELIFTIALHKKDKDLLEKINNYFGVGYITNHGNNTLQYRVKSVKDLNYIMEHFERYPLVTQKWSDFLLFKLVFDLVKAKEHLNIEGLKKIVSIRATLNKGVNENLKENFFEEVNSSLERPISPVVRSVPDPEWFAGFASAESCFQVNIKKSTSNNCGYQVWLIFTLTQHKRDENLMKSFESYLGCGTLETLVRREVVNFNVRKLSDIMNIVIPFFKKHSILGEKSKDFNDWWKVANLISEGKHLTLEGVEVIQKIKGGMNTKRKDS